MQFVAQRVDDILASLQSLQVDWKDETALRAIALIEKFPVKTQYGPEDVRALLENGNFEDGMLVARLFLGLSKDRFLTDLQIGREGKGTSGRAGAGVMLFRSNPEAFVRILVDLDLLEAMAAEANRVPRWSDVLVERLRSGRGSAISGQKRGRAVEDFAEAVVSRVFGSSGYAKRCTFAGAYDRKAKCDFAIPDRTTPRIVVEAKGYGATGSKMTDVIGDIEKIIAAKRPDTAFLLFTDGLTWKQRRSDLGRIIEYQNNGGINRIYTYAMAGQFEADLRQLKAEYNL